MTSVNLSSVYEILDKLMTPNILPLLDVDWES